LGLQIFVEDQLTEAYEVLALRTLDLPTSLRNRSRVRASRVEPQELANRESLLDLFQRAVASGYDCVIYILDREDPLRSPERANLVRGFRQAFSNLCKHQRSLEPKDPVRQAKAVGVICRNCLEGWLAADPEAVVDSVRSGQGIVYRPPQNSTDDLAPDQAGARIVHIIQEVGKRLQRSDLRRVTVRSVKSRGKSIAERLEPSRARRFNTSLDYFLSMVDCQRSGCDHPQPD
jgi:hypothetical protein